MSHLFELEDHPVAYLAELGMNSSNAIEWENVRCFSN